MRLVFCIAFALRKSNSLTPGVPNVGYRCPHSDDKSNIDRDPRWTLKKQQILPRYRLDRTRLYATLNTTQG